MARVTKQEVIERLEQDLALERGLGKRLSHELHLSECKNQLMADELNWLRSQFDNLMHVHNYALRGLQTGHELACHVNEVGKREQFNKGAAHERKQGRNYAPDFAYKQNMDGKNDTRK